MEPKLAQSRPKCNYLVTTTRRQIHPPATHQMLENPASADYRSTRTGEELQANAGRMPAPKGHCTPAVPTDRAKPSRFVDCSSSASLSPVRGYWSAIVSRYAREGGTPTGYRLHTTLDCKFQKAGVPRHIGTQGCHNHRQYKSNNLSAQTP